MEEFGSAIDVEERISNERKTEKDRKSLTIASETNRDYLTTIEAISVAGDVSSLSIFLVLSNKLLFICIAICSFVCMSVFITFSVAQPLFPNWV
jgi:hypothetical protein